MQWEASETHEEVLQDSGPWTWYLPEAWRQAAAPQLHMVPGRRPADHVASHQEVVEAHGAWIAYWSPLLHLTSFGLGWRRPELGLWRWYGMGRPTDDPVLATIDDRYGSDVALMDAWLVQSGARLVRQFAFGDDYAEQLPVPHQLSREVEATCLRPEYGYLYGGGGDAMHLSPHLVYSGTGDAPALLKVDLRLRGEQVDYVLVGEQYRSLVAALHSGTVPSMTSGRSTRVALVCPAIGWLGNYRRSRDTGLWFRGQHRWHELGN